MAAGHDMGLVCREFKGDHESSCHSWHLFDKCHYRWIDPWHVSPRCCLKNACRNRWVCMLEFTTPKKTSRTVVFRCIFQKKTPWVSHSPRYGSGWLESRSLCWRDTKVATLLEILKRKCYFPTIIFQALQYVNFKGGRTFGNSSITPKSRIKMAHPKGTSKTI